MIAIQHQYEVLLSTIPLGSHMCVETIDTRLKEDLVIQEPAPVLRGAVDQSGAQFFLVQRLLVSNDNSAVTRMR